MAQEKQESLRSIVIANPKRLLDDFEGGVKKQTGKYAFCFSKIVIYLRFLDTDQTEWPPFSLDALSVNLYLSLATKTQSFPGLRPRPQQQEMNYE